MPVRVLQKGYWVTLLQQLLRYFWFSTVSPSSEDDIKPTLLTASAGHDQRRMRCCRVALVLAACAGLTLGAAACTGGAAGPASGSATNGNISVGGAGSQGSAGAGSSGQPTSGSSGQQASGTFSLAFARCMRVHGVPNFPDPDGQAGQLGPSSGINPNSPEYQAAINGPCESLAPHGWVGSGKVTR